MVIRLIFYIVLVIVSAHTIVSCKGDSPRNEDGSIDGAAVFQSNCISCHGEQGDAEIAGAKNLKATTLNDQEIKHIIQNGSENGRMMPYKSLLSDEEIDALVIHIKSLKD